MQLFELPRPHRSFLDSYEPQDSNQMRAYVGPELKVPLVAILSPEDEFAFTQWHNHARTLFLFNFVHKDFPEAYCQIQVLAQYGQYHYSFFHLGDRTARIPDQIVLKVFCQAITPLIKSARSCFN